MALAAEAGRFVRGDRVALLGIGSGVNCQMIGVEWQKSLVRGNRELPSPEKMQRPATISHASLR